MKLYIEYNFGHMSLFFLVFASFCFCLVLCLLLLVILLVLIKQRPVHRNRMLTSAESSWILVDALPNNHDRTLLLHLC